MKARVGQFFIILGVFALILFGVSLQSEIAEIRLLLLGFALLLIGGWFFLRNRPARTAAERFRTLRKLGSRRKK